MLRGLFRPAARFGQNPAYRSDIDGLRALAVISVILFHLDIAGFGGGYVGVDLFFVISGFLITQHLRRDMEAGSFSFVRFYERRMRRLAPSLITALTLTCVGATLLLSPADMLNFGESMVASVLFAANIFFYVKSGYFTSDVDDKPLLHLWSLGVEEQFYLIWPLLLLLMVRRLSTLQMLSAMAALGVLSLLVAVGLGESDNDAAFYLIPSRLVEFLMGAGLVWIPQGLRMRKPLADVAFLAGLGMVVAAVTLYSKTTPFPSFYALLPCVGAALMIFGGREAYSRILISNRVVAYIGRISYELYLFHWPAIIFTKYRAFEALQTGDVLSILAITTVLAMFTYHVISCPLRYGFARDVGQRQNYIIGCLVVSLVLLGMALSMKVTQGWPWRLPEASRLLMTDPGAFHKTQYGGVGFPENTLLTLGDKSKPPQFIMIGDSFAGQYAAGLSDYLAARQQSAYLYYINGCLMMPHVMVHARAEVDRKCMPAFQQVMTLLQGNNLPVLQAQSWSSYKEQVVTRTGEAVTFTKENNDDYYAFMIDGIEQVRVALGVHRYVFAGISPGITEQKSIARCFKIPNYLPNQCAKTVGAKEEERQNGQEFNLAAAKYVAQHPEVQFMNPRSALCHDGMCYAIGDGKSFYSDYSHFTKAGAQEVLNYYQDMLATLHP